MRVKARRQYERQQVIDQLKPYLVKPSTPKPLQGSPEPAAPRAAIEGSAPQSPVEKKTAEEEMAPNCPKCGTPMALCVAAKGKFKGRRFYGCVIFPQCREVLPASRAY